MLLTNTRFIGEDLTLHHKDIRIEDETIVDIGDHLRRVDGESDLDCSALLILPALADCHVHSPDTLLRGLFTGVEMEHWCNDLPQGRMQAQLFEYLDHAVGSEDFETLVLFSYLTYLHNGVGFIVETGQADDSHKILASCAERIGLKALVDWYDELPTEESGCARIAIGQHLPEEEDLTETLLEDAVRRKRERPQATLMTHCQENRRRVDEILRKFGKSTVRLMHEHGLLDDRSLLFHCIDVSQDDIELLAMSKATAVCCPVSTMRIGEGMMPVMRMRERGINLVLGTDFPDHDIWDSMRFLATSLSASPSRMHDVPSLVFSMATRYAQPVGRQVAYSGVIACGHRADLCFLRHEWEAGPLIGNTGFSTVPDNLITWGHRSLVRHLMINGRFVLFDGSCTTVDERAIRDSYARILQTLFPN